MRNRSIFALFLLLAAAVCSAQNSLKSEITSVYEKWDRLVLKKDLKGILSMFDKSFHQVMADGQKSNLKQTEAMFGSMINQMQVTKCNSKVHTVQATKNKDEAVAWITIYVSGVDQMKKPFAFTASFAETLRKTPNGWKFWHSQEFPNKL